MLTRERGDEVVARGIKAVGIVYALTGNVPTLIKQSHLDKREGWHSIVPVCVRY